MSPISGPTIDQIEEAAYHKLVDLSKNKGGGEILEPKSKFLAKQIKALLSELARDDVFDKNALKRALKIKIRENNSQEQTMDKETFLKAVSNPRPDLPKFGIAEYRAAKRACDDGTWKEGETRTFTMLEFRSHELPGALLLIDSLCEDEAFNKLFHQ